MPEKETSLASRVVIFFLRFIKLFMSSKRVPLRWQRALMNLPGKIPFLLRGTDVERIELDRPGGSEAGPPLEAAWITPKGVSDEKVILYLHGGAFVLGSIDSHSPMVAEIARSAGCRALAVDYRLAPEHPCPAALEDCLAAYRWLVTTGYRPGNIVIAGDSAGGNLTAASLVGIRDSGGPLPAGAVMLSPATDLALSGDSIESNVKIDPIIDVGWGLRCTNMYLDGTDPCDPRFSPFYADLSGLPPMLIHCGTREVLYDDSVSFAARARAAGADCTIKAFDGMFHVFQACGSYMPESKESIRGIGDFCRKVM